MLITKYFNIEGLWRPALESGGVRAGNVRNEDKIDKHHFPAQIPQHAAGCAHDRLHSSRVVRQFHRQEKLVGRFFAAELLPAFLTWCGMG
jgi:hypothetical protein